MTRTFCVGACACAVLCASLDLSAQGGRRGPNVSTPSALPASPPGLPAPPAPSRSRTRLFAPQDLGLLEGPDRAEWQKPDQIMDTLKIADGSAVADVGAAGGWFTIHMARRVGPNGHVYAEDIQPLMIAAINRRVQRENLTNVTTVLGTPTDPRLPSDIDAVLIVNSYREMEIPPADPVTLLRNVGKSLRLRGRIGIVDFMPGGGGPGPAPDQRVNPETVISAAQSAGLQLISREAVEPFQYLLVFGKGR